MWLILEIVAVAVVLIVAFAFPRLGSRWFRFAGRPLARLAERRKLSIALVGLVALINCASSLLMRPAVAQVHDEFSFLLAADTFAHGRLTNPMPEEWQHFDSFHVILQPTYQSKYPPGQGLALAAGSILSGHAIVGVWLSTVLACGAVCWMLQAWLPPRWALLGGLLTAFHTNILLHWGWTYWGGSVAMLGGALLFGGMRRVMNRPNWLDAVWLALGLGLLANSRPYEGLVAAIPAMVVLFASLVANRERRSWRSFALVMMPLTIVLTLTGAAMGYYNYCVTGDPLLWPYIVYRKSHLGDSAFLWDPQAPFATNRFAPMRSSDPEGVSRITAAERPFLDVLGWLPEKLVRQSWFYFQALLICPVVTLPWLLGDRWTRFALLTCGLVFLSILPTYLAAPHYAAPVTCLTIVLLLCSLRHLRLFVYRGKPVGVFLVRAIPLVWIGVWLCVSHDAKAVHPIPSWALHRERIRHDMEARGGKHMVIVHYGPNHNLAQEWIYNEADLVNAQVIWARELGPAKDQQLIDAYKDREVWFLDADADPPCPRLVDRNRTGQELTDRRDP
jgi:hypothetical protein